MTLINNNSNPHAIYKQAIIWEMNKMESNKIKLIMRDMMNGLNTNKTGFYIISNFQIKNMKYGCNKMLILIFNKKK